MLVLISAVRVLLAVAFGSASSGGDSGAAVDCSGVTGELTVRMTMAILLLCSLYTPVGLRCSS